MKWFIPVFLLVATAARASDPPPADMLPPAPPGQTWNLVWHDEFDGETLDESKWDVPERKRRDAWWSRRAVEVKDGHLVIKTLHQDGKYYNACVRTEGRFMKAFGYFVARIRLQQSDGHWSAFWMYAPSVGTIGNEGRDGTEIDIMEKPKLDNQVQHTLHWDGYGEYHRSAGKKVPVPGILEGFHTFGLLWTPKEYVFYIDGKETWRTRAGGVCQVPLYLKLSDEAEFGGWAGDVRQARLPDAFLTDYVHVYDLVDQKTGQPIMKANVP